MRFQKPENDGLTRRTLLRRAIGGTGAAMAILSLPLLPKSAPAQAKEKPAALEPDLVRQFVGVAHRDIDEVKRLFEQEPGLLNAAWDWGGGDWETALGAASHTGRVEIAEFLLSKGARMDVFAAVMLGKTALFEAFLADDPEIVHLKGPHGLSLAHHAEKGAQTELLERINSLVGQKS